MFGHQDEPQQPVTTSFSAPDQATDSQLDAGLTDIVNSSTPSDPLTTNTTLTTPETVATDVTPTESGAPALPSSPAPAAMPTDTNLLLDIKQQALQQLSPLVNHLDQSPEEKFRTTMMMIQASDNQDLIGTAYAAAQAITDEKTRAQALLDLVNEINYFTQRQGK